MGSGGLPNRQHQGRHFLRGPQGLEPVPRVKRGSPKASQEQQFAQWLLWLQGRAVVKCSSEMLWCPLGLAYVRHRGNRVGGGNGAERRKQKPRQEQRGRNSRAAQRPEQASEEKAPWGGFTALPSTPGVLLPPPLGSHS